MTPRMRLSLMLLPAIAGLVACWLFFRDEMGPTESGPAIESTARPKSTPGQEPHPDPESTPPPRQDLTQAPAAKDERERVAIRGSVHSMDADATLAGQVDFIYRDSGQDQDRHAIAAIQPDRSFQLTLPRGVYLHRAEVRPARTDCNWRQTFLGSAQQLEDAGPLVSEREYSFRVTTGFTISGVVVDQASGRPIPRANVAIKLLAASSDSDVEKPGETNALGEFTVLCESSQRTPAPLCTPLTVRERGYLAKEIDVPEPERGTAVTGLRIALERGVMLRGRVVDAEGEGVAARLWAMQDLGERSPLGRQIAHCVSGMSSPVNGRFTLPALPRVDRIEVRARSSSHAPAHIRDLDLRGEPGELLIQLRPSVAFEVVATYPDGSPVWPRHGHLVFTDSSGDRHQSERRPGEGWQFVGEVGYTHPFSVRAIGDVPNQERRYQGAGTAYADGPRPAGQSAVRVEMELSEETQPEVPAAPPDVWGLSLEGSPAGGFTWELELVDAATHQPLRGKMFEVALENSQGFGEIGPSGRVRLTLGGGRRQLVLRVPGFETLAIETPGLDHGFAEATLVLRRR